MKVVVRVDANLKIGTGHLARCRVLADELRKAGSDVLFVCRGLPADLNASLREQDFDVVLLPDPIEPTCDPDGPTHRDWLGVTQAIDAEETILAMQDHGWEAADWLVVDHYAIDACWESRMRSCARRILVIDDLADRSHEPDLLLDQNLRTDRGEAYRQRVKGSVRLLIGPQYALLREGFAQERKAERYARARTGRVFIGFGGADEGDATAMAVHALCETPVRELPIDIVVSRLYPNRSSLFELAQSRGNARVHVDASNVAELMGAADIAIGGGGVMTWERCASGLPALAWPIALNQEPVLQAAADAGAILMPDVPARTSPSILASHVTTLLNNTILYKQMSASAQRVCDGAGAGRVVRSMSLVHSISVRAATLTDSKLVLEWRNHPSVRATAFNTAEILEHQHDKWYANYLKNNDRLLLLGEIDGEPCGVVRFDCSGADAEVSIYLAPNKQGGGLGGALLRAGEAWLRQKRPDTDAIIARVRIGNTASERLFGANGYQRNHAVWVRKLNNVSDEESA